MFENFREHKSRLGLIGLFLLFLALKLTHAQLFGNYISSSFMNIPL